MFETKGRNYIFITEDSSGNSASLSPVTYIACCKKFVNFQTDFFVKRELFPLRTIDCSCSWARRDVDFDYDDDFLEIYYDSDDNDSDTHSNSD